MGACEDRQSMLNGLFDGELDAANTATMEGHLASCHGCRDEFARMQALRRMITADGVRHAAPEGLRSRITASIDDSGPQRRINVLPSWLAPGAVGALAASLALIFVVPPGNSQRIEDEVIAGHIRSLQAEHLTDVRTSNQHLIKPWFNGKIDFSPPVPELSAQGFPLAGGRLDYAGERTVAAIVYRRRLHTINLFVWPASKGSQQSFEKDGYALSEWTRGGLHYVAVSDISPAEMDAFREAFIRATG